MDVKAASIKGADGQFLFVDLGREGTLSESKVKTFFKDNFSNMPILYRKQIRIGNSIQYSGDTRLIVYVRHVPLDQYKWKTYKIKDD